MFLAHHVTHLVEQFFGLPWEAEKATLGDMSPCFDRRQHTREAKYASQRRLLLRPKDAEFSLASLAARHSNVANSLFNTHPPTNYST